MRINTLTAVLLAAIAGLTGCDAPREQATTGADGTVVTVTHQLGTTRVVTPPKRVVAFDMSELDTLDQLQAPVAGIAKDYVAHFLQRYRDDPAVMDVGTTIQPNLERLHKLKPDLILISPLQAQSYEALSQIAPTLHYDIDMTNRDGHILEAAKAHLLTLGTLLGQEALAKEKVQQMDAKIAEVQALTQDRPERALIVLHNNGAFTAFGTQSRYGFLFDTLGVKPAGLERDTGMHGQPISNEFIQQADPDILFVIDRTAVMERRTAIDASTLDNPLLRQTKAWRNGKVRFVDPETWYLCTASFTCLNRIADEVMAAYRS
ncbi:TPA: siderophore ABC transporter substrate-binding protein [Aeromonas dhakensis]|nr:siderophore ABC transporter substrate-binding protein [Aeromonas dhakensis]